ncbi:conserved hypothetical protein [Pseudomonas sp. OF001]|uniref:hypothetical protein n=1 Tax=Pseudomonas sp. OF001 TaxID=2772300 RepID=UPI0019185D3E|nr:hypothetical protein [Pseudomonas sp. OF001]CAD5379720.1 conserved hypothetical protein [Pseudomonas sp. OF001]
MLPVFLPHACLDLPHGNAPGQLLPLTPREAKARAQLRALRDRALAEGAQVLILLWPGATWTLLAVEPPADVAVCDALELVPNLQANPEALEQMHQRAAAGDHLVWLVLQRPAATLH